ERNGTASPLTPTAAYLKDWASTTGSYVRVMITDSRGALVASTHPDAPYLNADQEWWQEAMEDDLGTAYVSSLRLDPTRNEYVFDVAVATPSTDRDEPFVSVAP